MPIYFSLALTVIYAVGIAVTLVFVLRSGRQLPIAYDLIYEAMGEAAILIDPQNRILSVNSTAERLFGKTSAQLLQYHFPDLIPAGENIPLSENWARTFECTLPDGVQCHGQVVPVMRAGVNIGRVVVLRDVTAQKRAEDALRASEQRAKALLDAVPDMMFRFSRDGLLLGYKAETNQLYGLDVRINQPPTEMFAPEFILLMLNAINETLDIGRAVTWEFEYPMPSGGLRVYDARIAPSGADEVIILVKDITEYMPPPIEAQPITLPSERALTLAKRIVSAREEFNPALDAIKATAVALAGDAQSDKDVKHLDDLRANLKHLNSAIDRLQTAVDLDFTRP